MPTVSRWLLIAATLISGCARQTSARADRAEPQGLASTSPLAKPGDAGAAAPFAVIELFTSEGCSSCPPADLHLAEIEAAARTQRQNVYALSLHVDYWDYLGWRDPFSDRRHSERQQRYARALGNGGVYTPQMIVNGREEFIGTARSKARVAIQHMLEQPVSLAIELEPELEGRRLLVGYRLEGDTHDTVLNLAVTQPAPRVEVERGENAGRTLAHRGVVRAFVTRELNGRLSGSMALELSSELEPQRTVLVAYAANMRTLAILGATSSDLHE